MKKQSILTLTLTSFLVACTPGTNFDHLVHRLPNAKVMMDLSPDLVTRTAVKSLTKLAPFLTKAEVEDEVLSPATYTLAIAGLSAVSDHFNNDAFGLIDAEADTKALLEAWNFEAKTDQSYTFFRSAVLHQQIGETYAFDRSKQEEVSDHYISSMVSSLDSYRQDADAFFKEKIGLNLKVPDLELEGDGVATYGVLKMKDYIPNGLYHLPMPFMFKTGQDNTDAYIFALEGSPKVLPYYAGSNYQAFRVNIRRTDLMVILPNENEELSQIDITEAYTKLISEPTYVSAFGYIPFFHNKVEGVNLSDTLTPVLTGEEIYFSKLLKEEVINDLLITAVLQSNDFEFNKYGVSGESMTVIPLAGTSAPGEDEPLDLSVNRPFYVFSLKDHFPIFINKVTNPGR